MSERREVRWELKIGETGWHEIHWTPSTVDEIRRSRAFISNSEPMTPREALEDMRAVALNALEFAWKYAELETDPEIDEVLEELQDRVGRDSAILDSLLGGKR